MTALSDAVRAKLGNTGPLAKPAMASPSPGMTSLAEKLKIARVPRPLLKVICPSPFQPRVRTVPIAEVHDVPVKEAQKSDLTAFGSTRSHFPPPSDPIAGRGRSGKPIAQANIQPDVPESDPKHLPELAEEFAEFLLLTDQSQVDVTTKCSLLKRSGKKKFLQKQF